MNRTDREITDKREIIDILKRCDTIRIGLSGGECPYVVPLSFGADFGGELPVLYIHGAERGLKTDLIAKDPSVCVEADIFYKVEETRTGITARYESVIGFGKIEKAKGDEKLRGLSLILEHYSRSDFPLGRCGYLDRTAVYKITLHSVTGKKNLPID